MATHFVSQILLSWLVATVIMSIFNRLAVNKFFKFNLAPGHHADLFDIRALKLSRRTKLIGRIVAHHLYGFLFTGQYVLLWHYEFGTISWETAVLVGLLSALVRIICWIFLIEIFPARILKNWSANYKNLLLLNNLFIVVIIVAYKFLP